MGKTYSTGLLTNGLTQDSSNNIGIGGAANASFKLQVTGATNLTGVLTLGSTISNGTFTYTLPSATGTLALTSDIPSLTGYVPYTGATTNVDLGNNYIVSQSSYINGNAGTTGGMLAIKQYNSSLSGANGYTTINAFGTTNLFFTYGISAGVNRKFSFAVNNISNNAEWYYEMPNASGTLALTSNLSAYLPLTGGTLSGALNINIGGAGGTGLNVASDSVIFRANTGVGTPRQLIFTTSGGTSTYLEAKGFGANYITDFGIRTYNASGTAFEVFYANAAGNVGIGITSPTQRLHVYSDISTTSTMFETNNVNSYLGLKSTSGTCFIGNVSHALSFEAGGSERMRITSGGNVGIGTSSPNSLASTTNLVVRGITGSATALVQSLSADAGCSVSLYSGASSADDPAIIFQKNLRFGSVTDVGLGSFTERMRITSGGGMSYTGPFISMDGSGAGSFTSPPSGLGYGLFPNSGIGLGISSVVSISFWTGTPAKRMTIDSSGNIGAPTGTNIYNASDRRLKQNIETISNGLDKIIALNPVKFNWIDNFVESENGKDMLGFIAQEVDLIIPEAVEKFSNNVIEVGDLIINDSLRVNEKFIIPVLVKAIQELKAELDELKNK